VIASIRGTDVTTLLVHPYFRPLLLSGLREVAWVTSVNQTYLDDVAREVDITGRSSVIRNSAPEIRQRWQLTDKNRGVVGCSGHFRRVKDIPLLVRSFRNVRPDLRRKLLLAGPFLEEAEEDWCWTLVREFSLSESVEVTGMLPHADILGQLARMHVYVQSSAFEGMPNTLLEAAAVGVPIVATGVGGVKEIFSDGMDALLVPHGDPVALGRAIERVLNDDDLAHSLSSNAALLCARFSMARERTEWVSLHKRLLASCQREAVAG
jgi:glycosyltransferase involved in cell wall biosynthesis